MDSRFVFFVFSVAVMMVTVQGFSEEDIKKASEHWSNKVEDMKFCLSQENVTEEEMKEFVINQKCQDENEPLKMAVLCFVKRINFFDGVSWNTEVITESESKNPKMLKFINDCLAKDDFTQQPQERAYLLQKCVLENGALE